MGSSYWSNETYEDRQQVRAQTKAPVFKHDNDIRTGKVQKSTHPSLDPLNMKGGGREARDSKEHPDSVPVQFFLDETGSMAEVPPIVQKKLGGLMKTILTKGILPDPQILFGAIGDAHTGHGAADREVSPFQVGQFESGLEMEDNLTNIHLEKNGGGQGMESYDLALYFAAFKTKTDAWDKRKRKGYLFITGDERNYRSLDAATIHRVFGGEKPDKDFTIQELVKAAQEKYHVFFIIPGGADNSSGAEAHWKELLGAEHVLNLSDPSQVCEVVALAIGVTEGTASASALTENVTPAVKAAMDPLVALTKAKVDKAKAAGSKTARL